MAWAMGSDRVEPVSFNLAWRRRWMLLISPESTGRPIRGLAGVELVGPGFQITRARRAGGLPVRGFRGIGSGTQGNEHDGDLTGFEGVALA